MLYQLSYTPGPARWVVQRRSEIKGDLAGIGDLRRFPEGGEGGTSAPRPWHCNRTGGQNIVSVNKPSRRIEHNVI